MFTLSHCNIVTILYCHIVRYYHPLFVICPIWSHCPVPIVHIVKLSYCHNVTLSHYHIPDTFCFHARAVRWIFVGEIISKLICWAKSLFLWKTQFNEHPLQPERLSWLDWLGWLNWLSWQNWPNFLCWFVWLIWLNWLNWLNWELIKKRLLHDLKWELLKEGYL